MKKLFQYSSLLFLSIMFFACDNNRVFEQNDKIVGDAWDRKQIINYKVNITDTITPTNFYINIRNTANYQFNNIFLYVHTTFPNNKKILDTLECLLADEKGKWLGKNVGDIYDNQILFKRGVRFPMSGEYTFEIEQAMRLEKLPDIIDVGLRIEEK